MSIARIWKFHKKQMPKNLSWKDELGIELGWMWKPIDRVGVYVPGGKASYPSSAIMNIIPAKWLELRILFWHHLPQMVLLIH